MPLLQNGSSQWGAAFSPDGRQVAFISDESGRPEVYVQAFESSPNPISAGTGNKSLATEHGSSAGVPMAMSSCISASTRISIPSK